MQIFPTIFEEAFVNHETTFDPWLGQEERRTFRQQASNTNRHSQNDSLEKIDAAMRDQ